MSPCSKLDFRLWPLLIFVFLLLFSCTRTAENPDAAIKKEAVGEATSEEKSSSGSGEAILSVSEVFGEENHCLSFSKGRDINRVEEFIVFFKLENYVTYEIKQTGELKYVDIFSASYDLDDDGKDEYFYYFDTKSISRSY